MSPRSIRNEASALVITLIVIMILSVIVCAFMTSMSIERMTAQSYDDILKAELAAEAACSEALYRLISSDYTPAEAEADPSADPSAKYFPVAAYEEVSIGYKGQSLLTPCLTLLRPNDEWNDVEERRYLTATRDPSDNSKPDMTQPPSENTDAETTDINAIVDDNPYGWIGLRNEDGTRRTIPAEWIYLKDSDGNVVGRYTFWVDDESSRIDMRTAGSVSNLAPPDLAHRRLDGSSPSEVAIHELFEDDESVRDFLSFRDELGDSWRGLLGYLQTPLERGIKWKSDLKALKASMGWGAKANERGAFGTRRIDLNDWVAKSTDFTTEEGRDEIAKKVIALGDFINDADPTFATRFYDNPSEDDRRQYCIKLAANIQDYIDTDHQPTVIRHNLGGWQEPPNPTKTGEGAPDQPPAAFGKEVVPAIGEYVGYYYADGDALRIDHTFEVWNIHAKPIDFAQLGNVTILMSERNAVTASTGYTPSMPGGPGNPPLTLSVPTGTALPGTYVLLTTLPDDSVFDRQWVVNSPRRIRLERAEPTYPYPPGGLKMDGDQEAELADVDTEISVTNQFGYLDIETRVAQMGLVNFLPGDDPNYKPQVIASQSFGNVPASTDSNKHRFYPLDSGDPRSFTEVWPTYSEPSGDYSSIAWRRNSANGQAATRLGGESYNSGAGGPSSGIIPTNLIASTTNDKPKYYVPEPTRSPDMNDPLEAVSIIRDGPMRTIGELGYIYDPAIPGDGYQVPDVRRRGGFRTLAIGSAFGEATGPNSLSQVNETNRASRLLELFTADKNRSGILLNSVLRDPANLPWRALLTNLRTQTNSTPNPTFPAPRDKNFPLAALVNSDAMIDALSTRARTSTPFLFLGQLGDLPIFNEGATLFENYFSIAATPKNIEVMDRGREEIFRHLAEQLTLKGSVYRVYVIGQAGRMNPDDKFVIRGTQRMMRLYELERTYPTDDPLKDTAMSALLDNNRPSGVRVKRLAEIKQ